jgi:hypothetical protein
MKLPPLPNDAADCRGYKNTILTTIGGFQKTEGSEVYRWALRALTAKSDRDLASSDGFPVLDRKLGVKLQASAKHGRFGLIFQTMVEEARKKTQSMPSGRQMLRRVFAEFDLEKQRGSMASQQQLLNIRLAGHSMNDLELFRDKVLYIRSAMEDDDLPKASTLESFIYQQLKNHPKMTTSIEVRIIKLKLTQTIARVALEQNGGCNHQA